MRIFVIRHGESETNRKKIWTGWFDAPLTEKGRKDAEYAGEILKNISFDKIYSSDLTRALQTAQTAIPGCSYESSKLLREIDVGVLAGTSIEQISGEQREITRKYGYGNYGGETKEELLERIKSFMQILEEQEFENIAVFSHAGWLRGMLDIVAGVHIDGNKVCCNNCTVAVFEFSNNSWRIHSWINPM